ncbi:hypothetical protein [Collimonas humicola]|uniref:hypothetical protein n=1 Tax=Collimonas humicola TaxID=2825886 RepID=UPI001B8B618F|nr:hypothetical protein [Collimonas humicola]
MSATAKLKSALRAIDDARTALRRAKGNADSDDEYQIRKAISELDDAERYIKRAINEVPSD